MSKFEHIRHKEPTALTKPRELRLVVAPLRSSVNLSRLVRLAGCCGLDSITHCGHAKVDRDIARAASDVVKIKTPRTLPPVVTKLNAKDIDA